MSELPSFIADHLKRYQDSDGADGHLWDSTAVGGPGLLPCLLLTTKGRRSGKEQPLPLIYGKCESGYVVVASKGGAPANPGWYLNLVDEPRVGVQVGADRFVADARTATGSERNSTPAARRRWYSSSIPLVHSAIRAAPTCARSARASPWVAGSSHSMRSSRVERGASGSSIMITALPREPAGRARPRSISAAPPALRSSTTLNPSDS